MTGKQWQPPPHTLLARFYNGPLSGWTMYVPIGHTHIFYPHSEQQTRVCLLPGSGIDELKVSRQHVYSLRFIIEDGEQKPIYYYEGLQ